MKEGQEKIYYIVNNQFDLGLKSPYMEPFKNNKDVDVLILTNNVDEIIFQQSADYKGKKFTSIESNFDEIQKDLGLDSEMESLERSRIPEQDISGFCIWLKEELKDSIGKVTISKDGFTLEVPVSKDDGGVQYKNAKLEKSWSMDLA